MKIKSVIKSVIKVYIIMENFSPAGPNANLDPCLPLLVSKNALLLPNLKHGGPLWVKSPDVNREALAVVEKFLDQTQNRFRATVRGEEFYRISLTSLSP